MPTRQDLEASPTLSIVDNGPQRFEGRKLGILVTDGTDAALLKALKTALTKAGATFEIIAPKVGGAKASDGSWIEADQMIDGGAIGAVRRRRAVAGRGRDGRPAAGIDGARFCRRRVRPLQVHRLRRGGGSRCWRRPASPRRTSTRASLSLIPPRTRPALSGNWPFARLGSRAEREDEIAAMAEPGEHHWTTTSGRRRDTPPPFLSLWSTRALARLQPCHVSSGRPSRRSRFS